MNYKQLEKALPSSYDLPHGRPPMEGTETQTGFFEEEVFPAEEVVQADEFVPPVEEIEGYVHLNPATGSVGDEISVESGWDISGTAEVYVNGFKADFVVVSETSLVLAIPQGATSGYVELVLTSGSIFSSEPLEVV
jgi:hypothetical protein